MVPQALRVIIPPLTSQYLNLAKNSSLGVAIAYPDFFSIASTINNQTGQAVEVIAITMAVYLTAEPADLGVHELVQRADRAGGALSHGQSSPHASTPIRATARSPSARTSIGWLRRNLFNSPFNSVLTLAIVVLIAYVTVPLLNWAFLNATWNADSKDGCTAGGACWAIFRVRWRQYLYGLYPPPEQWRLNLAAFLARRRHGAALRQALSLASTGGRSA